MVVIVAVGIAMAMAVMMMVMMMPMVMVMVTARLFLERLQPADPGTEVIAVRAVLDPPSWRVGTLALDMVVVALLRQRYETSLEEETFADGV